MTYNEVYDKIIQAYFKDEIQPKDAKFCFCGTLCNNSSNWFGSTLTVHLDFENYTGSDYLRMEKALFEPLIDTFWNFTVNPPENENKDPRYEDALFAGMSAALEVLKQIHRERGEDVDSVPVFTKRQLVS